MKRFVVASIVAVCVALAGAPSALAAQTECDGAFTGTADNVVVPEGAHCEMDGATITGNVLVRSDASLRASFTEIGGNVKGIDSSWVCLQFGSTAGGNFDVTGGDLGTTTGFDITTSVGGNAKVRQNAGLTFIDAATVGGNVDVSNNTGNLEIEHNTIGGNVKIDNNVVPVEYTGGPAQPLPGACGVPTSFILDTGGMSIFTNTLPSNNMHVLNNTGPGNKQVVTNTVKHIVCFGNTLPFLGGPNIAEMAQGQCFVAP
jgi:hypothetical protein